MLRRPEQKPAFAGLQPRLWSSPATKRAALCAPWRAPPVVAPRRMQRRITTTTMILDNLTNAMSSSLRALRGVDRLTPKNVEKALRKVRRALLDADVALPVVKELLRDVQKRVDGLPVDVPGVTPGDLFVRAVYEELVTLMGGDPQATAEAQKAAAQPGSSVTGPATPPIAKATSSDAPAVVLLAGLQGAGKTTAAAKLARYLTEKEGRKVLLVAGDIYRPAAVDQLITVGGAVGCEVYSEPLEPERPDPADIASNGIQRAIESKCDTVIVDTAGRQVIDSPLMEELARIKQRTKAEETLLVVDAMTGQEAATLTRAFNDKVGVTGAILTKLDGDTRGGAALSVQKVSGKPVKFIGVGEKLDKLEVFYPDRMASRILGMGDVLSLVEKAQEQFDENEAAKVTEKMMDASFNFEDFMKQARMMNSMGSLAGVAKMIPGVGKIDEKQLAQAEVRMKVAQSLINSMTKQERRNPELLLKDRTASSRLSRIANGSGRTTSDAKSFLREFTKMRTMMQNMSKKMVGPGGAAGGQPVENRAARRRAAKKKAERTGSGGGGFGR